MTSDLQQRLGTLRAVVTRAFTPPPVRHDDLALSWHPMVLAPAADAALADFLLDVTYADRPHLLHGKCITLVCPALADGMGDLALAMRVRATLWRHAPAAQITMVVPDPALVPADLASGRAQDRTSVLPATAGIDAVSRCDALIIAPGPAAARYVSPAMQTRVQEGPRRFPALAVSEYGSGAAPREGMRTLATGLGPLTCGMLIDTDLAAAAAQLKAASPQARRAAMQAWVAAHVPGAVAPAGGWCALSIIYVREREAVPAALARAWHSFAVAPDAAGEVLMLVVRHNLAATEAVALQQQLPVVSGPRARIMSVPVLPPSAYQAALTHADFAVVTGDQSLAEAIATGVGFAYEVRSHKQSLMHRLQETASRFGGEVHRAMAPLGAALPEGPFPEDGWRAMCADIRAHHDATARLAGRVARTLWASDACRMLERAVTDACALTPSARDVQLVQHLQTLQATLDLCR